MLVVYTLNLKGPHTHFLLLDYSFKVEETKMSRDKDQDTFSSGNCAERYGGGGGHRVVMLVQWVDRATQVVFFLCFVIF